MRFSDLISRLGLRLAVSGLYCGPIQPPDDVIQAMLRRHRGAAGAPGPPGPGAAATSPLRPRCPGRCGGRCVVP